MRIFIGGIVVSSVTMANTDLILNGKEEMGTIKEVWESFGGDLWILTEVDDDFGFGYARLASMPQFAEWGTINRKELQTNPKVWKVERRNWRNINTYDGIEVSEVAEQVSTD